MSFWSTQSNVTCKSTESELVQLTQEEVSRDVCKAVEELGIASVPEFLLLVKAGKFKRSDYVVRELVGLIRTLPADDPAFHPVDAKCLTSTK